MKVEPGFTITDHKGFRITFENGWTLSVQFGIGNYSDHYNGRDWQAAKKTDFWFSKEAETAVISPTGKFIGPDGSDVQGYQKPADLVQLIAYVERQPREV